MGRERCGSSWAEWWRQAAALGRSPFARPEHMLAIRISPPLERDQASVRAAEARICQAWFELAPELTGYAPTEVAASPAPETSGRR